MTKTGGFLVINLKDVTLVCVDDVRTKESIEIIEGVSQNISFGDIKLLSSMDYPEVTNRIESINSKEKYSSFVVKDLHKYVDTEFCMIMQSDGYPVNIKAWTDDFLKYDYIGAPWIFFRFKNDPKMKTRVGNGGFSLRSKKLLKEASALTPRETRVNPEDAYITKGIGEELKSKGISFAPVDLAIRFSVEKALYTGQFGFHGHKDTIKRNKEWGVFNFNNHAYEEGAEIKTMDKYNNFELVYAPPSKKGISRSKSYATREGILEEISPPLDINNLPSNLGRR